MQEELQEEEVGHTQEGVEEEAGHTQEGAEEAAGLHLEVEEVVVEVGHHTLEEEVVVVEERQKGQEEWRQVVEEEEEEELLKKRPDWLVLSLLVMQSNKKLHKMISGLKPRKLYSECVCFHTRFSDTSRDGLDHSHRDDLNVQRSRGRLLEPHQSFILQLPQLYLQLAVPLLLSVSVLLYSSLRRLSLPLLFLLSLSLDLSLTLTLLQGADLSARLPQALLFTPETQEREDVTL